MYKKRMQTGIVLMLVMALVCAVVVPIQAASLKISKTSLNMAVGQSRRLTVNTNRQVKWKSSKPAVASVNKKGTVTAKKRDSATVTATVGKKKLRCRITVKAAAQTAQTEKKPWSHILLIVRT